MSNKKRRDIKTNLEKEKILNPKKVQEKKKQRQRRTVICVVCALVFLAALGIGGFQTIRVLGRNNLKSKVKASAPDLTAGADTLSEEEENTWQEGWVKYKGIVYAYNEDIMTFLIMGIDKNADVEEVAEGTSGGQADALFLAVMNPHDSGIRVIGINRNAMTDIDIYNETGAYVTTTKAQIAVQHGFGNGMEESCEYQKKAVQKLFYNLPIHGYAAINMSAIPTINDAVGGVDVTVLEDLTRVDETLIKGNDVHLMGKSAFWYVKYRDTKVFASADRRLDRQKQYLNAFIKKAKKSVKGNISIALDLYKAVGRQMVTDISADEVAYLAPILADYSFDKDSFYMLAGETVRGEQFEEFYVDENALYELILDLFYEEVKEP